MTGRTLAVVLIMIAALATGARAHEVRPAYLELTETGPGRYDMLWKVPARGERTLRLEPRLPGGCEVAVQGPGRRAGNAVIRRSTVLCPDGLAGGTIGILGLEATLTDVLLRIERRGGDVQTALLTPDQPATVVVATAGLVEVARTYLALGVDHILEGFDHLLFVLALLLLVAGWRRIALTVTAFTLAHSLTLAAATLDLIRLPPGIVEALIALSIVLVAVEVVRARTGEPTLGGRMPWLITFVFGLLHGLGFAGALAEIGLPAQAIPAALLFFNLGVEAGQLMVVAAVLLALHLAQRVGLEWPRWSWRVATYAIGSLAALWTIERLSALA